MVANLPLHPQWQRVADSTTTTQDLLERLLLEKIPLAGRARVLQVSERWLQSYVNAKYEAVPQKLEVQPKLQHRLTVQMDELWSEVDDKGNEQWVWLAIDAVSREIVGCYIGDRTLSICPEVVGVITCSISAMFVVTLISGHPIQ